ncbi:MAG: hypothetical protein OXG24_06005 [Gammaproteobacteria bacterium]|nr:hypothetical protein [Gammaproteobacteria bacterium]
MDIAEVFNTENEESGRVYRKAHPFDEFLVFSSSPPITQAR